MASEELVTGEVLPPTPPASGLSLQQIQAATLDAAGMSRKAVSDAVGVSQSTIKDWRRNEQYAGEVQRLKQAAGALLAKDFEELEREAVDGARAAIKTLVEALTATGEKGKPAWQTRLRAADKLTELGFDVRKLVQGAQGEHGGGGGGSTVLVIKDG